MNQSTALDDYTLKENLSRLSNLMSTQKELDGLQTSFTKLVDEKDHIYEFEILRQTSSAQGSSTNAKTYQGSRNNFHSELDSKTITKQQMYRPQSMALFKQISEFRELKHQESSIKQDLSHYKDWVGLSVVDRNEIFQKEAIENKKLKEEKEQQIINTCTFTPKLSQQIKYSSPQSQIISKSYLDLHKQKQNYNDKLY